MLRRISPNVIGSRRRRRSAGALAGVAMLTFLATACAGSGTTTGPTDAGVAGRGVLTGAIIFVGGPLPLPPGKQRPPAAGLISVFSPSGRVVARAELRTGERFRFALPAGHYELNAGATLRFHFPNNCRPKNARVDVGRTTLTNVDAGCGIQ